MAATRASLMVVSLALTMAMTLAPPGSVPRAVAQSATQGEVNAFNAEQLDALLAPIALYPDPLITQVLMAATFPIQIVEAERWLQQGNDAQLRGEALTEALASQNWDPSVKSLVPFPEVLAMMDSKLDWTQQVGYAFANQQADVMNSIQRLRDQAQQAGSLHSTPQQTVSSEQGAIVIQPANPQVVYVPVYNPTVVYGTWPYPAMPPVYFPPPGTIAANAFISGLAFASGVAVVNSLWGWARPAWGGGNVNINVNRWNNINVHRTTIHSNVWRPSAPGIGGRPIHPPRGPVGAPARLNGLPANAIGRRSVEVNSSLVSRPPAGRGNLGREANRPGHVNRPAAGAGAPHPPNRAPARPPSGIAQRPPQRPPVARPHPPARTEGAFGGINEGARARQYGTRGAQSRGFQNRGVERGGFAARPSGGFGGRRR